MFKHIKENIGDPLDFKAWPPICGSPLVPISPTSPKSFAFNSLYLDELVTSQFRWCRITALDKWMLDMWCWIPSGFVIQNLRSLTMWVSAAGLLWRAKDFLRRQLVVFAHVPAISWPSVVRRPQIAQAEFRISSMPECYKNEINQHCRTCSQGLTRSPCLIVFP